MRLHSLWKKRSPAGLARPAWQQQLWRMGVLMLLSALALQLSWLLRIALMQVVDPESTSFQRSEAWRLLTSQEQPAWAQTWVDAAQHGQQLPRAVVASEDSGFVGHGGVDWDSIQSAWQRNRKAEARAAVRAATAGPGRRPQASPKVVGGSTITQQLAKNLLLSGERTVLRKVQELLITLMLEALLPKERILEIYLNSVEWGEGLFGAQAAARHYFRVDAHRLSSEQAARLAVMLPAPKRHEKAPGSELLRARAATVMTRMSNTEVP